MKVITWNDNKEPETIPESVNPNTDEVNEEVVMPRANIAIYLLTDNAVINMTAEQTTVNDNGQDIIISDVNSENALLIEGANNPPDEWFGYRYFYTSDNGWVENTNWVDPRVTEPQ